MSNYLIELSAVHLALIVGYWLFLRKERQYTILRFYLIGTVVLALAIPLFKLPKLFNTDRSIDVVPSEVITFDSMTLTSTADASTWGVDLLVYMYVVPSLFFLYKFLNSVRYLIHLRRKDNYEKSGDLCIHRIRNSRTSFSFFKWIFIGENIDKDETAYFVMLEHEKAHAFLGHTYDVIFLQLFKASFWWLPTAWLITKEIKKIHEYQADAYVLKSYSVDQYSSILISSTLKLNGIGLVSSFHDGLILKRLTAMKQQTKRVSPWKLGALSALSAVLFTVFACSEEQNSKVTENETAGLKKDIFVVVEALPEAEGGMSTFYSNVSRAVNYPSEALQKGIEGRVDVQFVVNKDGSVSEVTVVNGIGAGCDDEAVKAIRNAASFKPGHQGGKPVRVRMVVPILFKLDDGVSKAENNAQGTISVGKLQPKNESFNVTADYSDGEWSGNVYDAEGEALPGVNVLVTGTTTGTVSDLDGAFIVKADESNGLYLSFVGYESVRLKSREASR